MERDWRWRASDTDDIELRYGFYAIHERLEAAAGSIVVGRAGAFEGALPIGPAVPALGAMTAARWDLHGVLAPLGDATLDADPGGGEWTVRQTLGHIVSGQLSYSWLNAFFLANPVAVGAAEYPGDGDLPPEPTEEELGAGTLAEVRERFDRIADHAAVAVAALDPTSMSLGARWSELHVSIDFRLGRYGSHIREHVVQVEKTLAMLRREPTEAERLVRLDPGDLRPPRGAVHRTAAGRSGPPAGRRLERHRNPDGSDGRRRGNRTKRQGYSDDGQLTVNRESRRPASQAKARPSTGASAPQGA